MATNKTNWGWKKLGEVADIIMGQSPPSDTYNEKQEGLPFFQGKAEFGTRFPEVRKYCSKPVRIAEQNNILMSVRAPVGSLNIANQKCCIGRGLCAINPSNSLNYLFLYHFLKSIERSISEKGEGSTFTAINRKTIENIEIPVPPLQTQQKIVSILERAESLKQKREQANEETNKIIQNIFYKMFGDPHLNEKGFEILSGKDIFILSSGKFNPTKNLDESYSYPTYGGNGVTGNSKEYLIDFDTIVIGRVGAYCGSVYKTKGKIWITDNAIYLKEILKNVNLDYLLYFFKTQNLNKFSAQSGQPKITQKPLENMKIPLPPISLQNQFASIVEKIESIKAKQSKATSEINTLFDALMQKAFKGELVD